MSERLTLEQFAGFCEQLTLDNGQPLMLEPFQREFLAPYFEGARELLVIQPKKAGKTTTIAALALFHCLMVRGAECVVAAASRDQAGILLRQAKGFIDRSEKLARWLHVKDREIVTDDKRGRIRILAADADTADGIIPTLAIVDELHRAKSADVYGIFRDGLGARNGQMVTISTAGDSEASVLGELRAKVLRLPGIHTQDRHTVARSASGDFVFHEWSLSRDDDVDDLEVVKLANPASWQTLDELRRRHDSPSTLPWQWLRFACGIWTSSEAWWLTGEQWAQAERQDQIRPGERVTLGFDGSRTGDATALVACRLSDGLLELVRVWEAPQSTAEWRVPGGEVDAAVAAAFERFEVARMYCDPPLWQSEIEGWEREFGSAVRGWGTNRPTAMKRRRRALPHRPLGGRDDARRGRDAHAARAELPHRGGPGRLLADEGPAR